MICHNEQKLPAGSLALFSVGVPDAPLDCVSGILIGLIRNLQKFQSALNRRKPFLGVFREAVHRSLHIALPVRLGNQNPVTELHDTVVAGAKPVVETLDADAVFREVVQMLFHGVILRIFHSVGSSPFGMHILPSCAEDSKRLCCTIICPEYRAECTSLSALGVLLNELTDYFIKELRVIVQRLTAMRKINFDLVLDHLLGSLQREAGLILVTHIVVDVHDKVHDSFVVHTHSSVAPPPRHTAPV
nr:MAG TPA: hypothetical protein [Caudoviricetes sp.]